MAELSIEEVIKVARLANLKISGDEMERMVANLSDVLKHIDLLDRLDTSGVPPTSHVLEIENVFRSDEPTSLFEKDRSLDNAPAQDRNYFSVPRVIE